MFYEEWNEDLAAALAEPFAAGDHKTKKQGGSEITFVDVHRYKERLNATVGPHGWSSYLRLEPIGGKLVCTVGLTVLGVTKENVGDEVEVPEVNERGNEKIIGGPATNSYAQAFKRAASDFGLGAYLYDKDKREAGKRGERPKASALELDYLDLLISDEVFTDTERAAVKRKTASEDAVAVQKSIARAKAALAERKQAVPA